MSEETKTLKERFEDIDCRPSAYDVRTVIDILGDYTNPRVAMAETGIDGVVTTNLVIAQCQLRTAEAIYDLIETLRVIELHRDKK